MTGSAIIDRFGRKHTYLRISLTDRCNLRCFYCMPEHGIELMEKPHLMTIEEIIGIAKVFVRLGVDTIRLTGGEPLIRKNAAHLIRELARLGVKLKLTTNGILLDHHFDLLEETGLRAVNISLDTLDKARSVFITKRNYYDRIMANIQEAIRRAFYVKLNVVLIRGVNDREIADFVRLTEHRNIAVKFIEFMPFKDNRWDWARGIGKAEVLAHVDHAFGRTEKLIDPAHSTSANYKIPGFKGSFGIVSTVTSPFCHDCNRIRLTANGRMKNCLFASKETDLLTPYREGADIGPLIISSIQEKKFSRDGMDTLEPDQYEKNRAMVAIGG